MCIDFKTYNYDKYVDIKIEVDGIMHDLGFHNEEQSKHLLIILEDAVEDLRGSIECNSHFNKKS